jgi:hypothetical protein
VNALENPPMLIVSTYPAPDHSMDKLGIEARNNE